MGKMKSSNSNVPPEKANSSTGSRGDAAIQRNQSGNHHGDRVKSSGSNQIKHR